MKRALLSAAVRHWPFANGAGRLMDKLGHSVDLGTGERLVRTSDGFDLTVLADDLIGRAILMSGAFDRSIVRTLLDFSAEGDQVLDVGANIGYVSGMVLRHVPQSHVIAVEPQPDIADLLQRNLMQFGQSRFSVIRAALSDEPGELALHVNHANRGASKIVSAHDENSITVPVFSAARVLSELERLDLMKMDIEGHEEPVFRGAMPELERLQPRAIVFEEQHGKASPEGPIGRILVEIGYRLFGIQKKLLSTALVPVTSGNVRGFNDFIAVSSRRPTPSAGLARLPAGA